MTKNILVEFVQAGLMKISPNALNSFSNVICKDVLKYKQEL